MKRFLFAFLMAWMPGGWVSLAGGFDQSHSRYARVLQATVNAGRVDYAALKASPGELDAYLEEIATVPRSEFDQWSRPDQLALLLNLYNAETLRLIRDRYPLKSIRSIGVLPGAAWRQLVVRFGGQIATLDFLENQVIRPNYREPDIHFALVCAARGCPPLRSEPYLGSRLSEQLADQRRQFLGMTDKNRFDARENTLWLSPIFRWYESDFLAAKPSLAEFVLSDWPAESRPELAAAVKPRVRFTEYDWSLNDRPAAARDVTGGK
ncbi:MAG: DUF547 domain-containing protein [Verrucomicrobia bacterium]|nr:DUF547 domain-containing protein [Verrucomicrobiota bacterium]